VKFIIENSWLIGIAVVSGGALLWPLVQQRGARVSTLQATQLINQGKALIVDVRDPAEFALGHMRDAKNLPLKELPQRIAELDKFKGKTIVIVCQAGQQSTAAASRLKKAGFNEVYSLNGGLAAWQAQGLPVAK
jgi:rhodanese-related sulfurtransferase